MCTMYVVIDIGLEARAKAGCSVRKYKGLSKRLMFGARIVVEGVSEKWLNWDSEGNAADIC